MGIEFRVSNSTTSATPPILFALAIFEIGSDFMSGQPIFCFA
jgi:hypothetical protein